MSNRALRWAFRLPVKGAPKAVLLALADCLNDDTGRCNPSGATLALYAGVDERTVRRACRALVAGELITITDRPGRPSQYILAVSAAPTTPDTTPAHHEDEPRTPRPPLNWVTPDTTPSHPGHHARPTPDTVSDTPDTTPPEPLEPPVQPQGNPQHVHVAQDLFAGPQPLSKERGADAEAFPQPSSLTAETSTRPPARQHALARPAPVEEATAIWNRLCGSRLPVVSTLNDKRRRDFAARFKDSLGADMANWETVCREILANDFLTGGGERGWCATFDWIMRPGKITQILESRSVSTRDRPKSSISANRNGGGLLAAVGRRFGHLATTENEQ